MAMYKRQPLEKIFASLRLREENSKPSFSLDNGSVQLCRKYLCQFSRHASYMYEQADRRLRTHHLHKYSAELAIVLMSTVTGNHAREYHDWQLCSQVQ